MKRVTVIGTGHVFRLRQKVRKLIQDIHPQAVCVELDEGRYEVLLEGRTSFHPLSLLQARLADRYHTIPGNDMLGGVEGARDVEAEIFFIDRDIEVTKRRLGEAFVLEFLNPLEIFRKIMLFPLLFLPLPRWGSSLEEVVKEFEKDPKKYRKLLGRAFPVFKEVLLDEREEHMADRIRKVLERFNEVAVVTGAGHAAELKKLLADFDVELVPLAKLLDG